LDSKIKIKCFKCSNYASLYVLSEDGKLYSCGYNGYGELGLGHNNNVNTL